MRRQNDGGTESGLPQLLQGMSKQEAYAVIALWADLFADEPYELVMAAVKRLIASRYEGIPRRFGAGERADTAGARAGGNNAGGSLGDDKKSHAKRGLRCAGGI